jgi:hypothetical protein
MSGRMSKSGQDIFAALNFFFNRIDRMSRIYRRVTGGRQKIKKEILLNPVNPCMI